MQKMNEGRMTAKVGMQQNEWRGLVEMKMPWVAMPGGAELSLKF